MEPVFFWPFPRVTGCCEHFYSHLTLSYIEECRWDEPERDAAHAQNGAVSQLIGSPLALGE